MMLSAPKPTPNPLPLLNELGRRGLTIPRVVITPNTSISKITSPFDRSSPPTRPGSGLTPFTP
jgi:hypothetical protein